MYTHKCKVAAHSRVMNAFLCAAAIGCAVASNAHAVVVDDFSGDLSAYTKAVVLTNSGNDEATSLGMTSFVINENGQLDFNSYVTNSKAYQTVLLRDDFSLAVGDSLRIEIPYFNDIAPGTTPISGVGVAIAATKYQTFNVRQDLIMLELNGYATSPFTGRVIGTSFQGTTNQGQKIANVIVEDVTGLFIVRLASELYGVGYSTSVGDVAVGMYANNSFGLGAAVGLYGDCRATATPLAKLDNLEIRPEVIESVPGAAPTWVLDSSGQQGSYAPALTHDAVVMWAGTPAPSAGSYWLAPDDTPGGSPVTGHVVYDLGTAMQLSDLTLWARADSTSYLLPKEISVFRFADDNPYGVFGAIDDIEGDPNIIQVWSGTLKDYNDGVSQSIQFDSSFTGRYVGIRIDSSYEKTQSTFHLAEVRFNAGDQNPAALPGVGPTAIYDFSDIKGDDSDFKPERMIDGLVTNRNMWVAEDDDPSVDGVNGHVVFDMSLAQEFGGVRIWSRADTSSTLLPDSVKVFGFADDNPTNILGAIDDIEGDANIVQLWSGSLAAMARGDYQDLFFSTGFTGRYLGLRVDSSQAEADGNFQIAEVRFLTDVLPPVPGDANGDRKVDDADAKVLAANWGIPSAAGLASGDFNGDGKVNAVDASILAANWGYGVSAAESTAVPEPTAAVLLIGVFLGLVVSRRR